MVKRSYAQLEAENELLRQQVKIIGALHLLERFHAFDAIQDDGCPCCGARVEAAQDPDHPHGVLLRAVR